MFASFPIQVPHQQLAMNSLDTFVELVGCLSEIFANSLQGMVPDKSCSYEGCELC